MKYYFTSESVSEGHPDKVSDQISDAIVDRCLSLDKNSKVACEVFVTTDLVVVGGEVKTTATFDEINIEKVVRNVIKDIGYTDNDIGFSYKDCKIMITMHEQSADISAAVVKDSEEEQGAGDQGIMFGYAVNESENYMPLTIELSHLLLQELADIRREKQVMTYLRPDAKSQVTIEYENNKPYRIDTILISTQHEVFSTYEFGGDMRKAIHKDIESILIPRLKDKLSPQVQELFRNDLKLIVNPSGNFVIGGPNGDTGLTGRKIIVDTYGGACPHGGGAFCFSSDTIIKSKDGNKLMSDIKIGDEVYTYNFNTNEKELKKVLDIFEKSKEDSYDLLELELENGEKIKITENHEVRLSTGEWKKAKNLTENDDIIEF